MKKLIITTLTITAFCLPVFADNTADDKTVGQKVEAGYEKTKDAVKEGYEDTKKGAKKAYRGAKDKTCEMVNGKMECAMKKAGNKIGNGVDEVKDKANDLAR